MINPVRGILFCIISITLVIVQCSTPEVSGIEVTNGTCVGKIYTKDNKAAVRAMVRLIPSGYDPSSSGADEIMTTETDAKGQYAFTVTKTDFYNIIAEKGSASCMQDSLSLLVDAGRTIDPDTLEESGWLAGKVTVKPGSDPLQELLLITGTYQYTSPDDSMGNFTPLSLPAGVYTVKVFTTENGYTLMDTSVTIKSGDTTWLDTHIPTSYAPEIEGFTVAYDEIFMLARLRWEPIDAVQLKSFALYRYVNGTEDSIIIIDKNKTEFTDDCIMFLEDTITYEMTAIGENYKEGYVAKTAPFVVCSKSGTMQRVLVDGYSMSDAAYSFWWISADYSGGSCISSNNKMIKLDDEGTILKEMESRAIITSYLQGIEDSAIIRLYLRKINGTDSVALTDGSINSISFDTHGDIYVDFSTYVNSGTRFIHKLDEQFNVIASLDIQGLVCEPEEDLFFTVGDDGYVYLHDYCDAPSGVVTRIRVYDEDFSYIDEYTFDYFVRVRRCYGDTILATTFIYPEADIFDENSELQRIMLFDRSFNLLTSYESIHIYSLYPYLMGYPGRQAAAVFPISDTLCMSVIGYDSHFVYENDISRMILIIYDNSGKLVGRLNMPGDFSFSINSSEELYGFSTFFGPYVYRINLASFLSE